MIVLDASVLVELLLRGPESTSILTRLRRETMLHVPELADLEVAQVIRRYELRAEITEGRARMAMEQYGTFRLTRHRVSPFLPRIWQLRHNLTAYDGCYVALAEALGSPLITTDGRLGRAGGHGATVEVISSSKGA